MPFSFAAVGSTEYKCIRDIRVIVEKHIFVYGFERVKIHAVVLLCDVPT